MRGRLRLAAAVGFLLVLVSCSSTESDSDDGISTSAPDSTVSAEAVDVAGESDASPPATGARGFTPDEEAEFKAAVADYIQTGSVANARRVVELITLSGELRFAPWLVDLVQMGLSNTLNSQIIDTLSAMTGIEPEGKSFIDFGRIGSYVDSQNIDPGEGYRAWKLTLYGNIDPAFVPLIDSVKDDERFTRIRYGGVRRGGIPELNDPARISSEEALEWITDDEVVLGVDIEGEAVAYPFRIVGHHELVNDTVAGLPVSLVYCTLCRTGILFDRRVDGEVLDFQTSGLLINSNKIMVDRQTDTLWHHAAGVAIGGPLDGVTLEVFPMETTTWVEWYAEHPDTEVLDFPEPIFFDDPERPPIAYPYEAEGPYVAYYENPEAWFPIRQPSDALEVKDEVIGIEHLGGVLALAVDELTSGPDRVFTVGDGAIVVVPNSRGARVYATGPEIPPIMDGLEPGSEIEVTAAGTETAVLADGTEVQRLAVEQGFWFSWFDRHPTTELWPQR